ncbi:ATP-binding protein [Thermodesulfobacteriota bacterium]
MDKIREYSISGKKTSRDVFDRNFYTFIINSLPVAVLTVDTDLNIMSFNPWAEEITGYREEEAIGHHCGEILKGGMCGTDCPLMAVINHESTLIQAETTIFNRQGNLIPVRMNTAGIFDDEGHLIGGVEAFHDISRLKAMEREKDNIISMFAHDMKSSITVIGGFALRLSKRATSLRQEKQNQYLEIIKKESEKLETIVEDFLEFSRLQTGKLKLEFSAISIDKDLIELFEAYQSRASQAGVRLELENKNALPVIEADSVRLRRAFANLVDNALKYSREGGRVIISTHETNQDIIIKVTDQGVGISDKDLPYIFDPFHRGQIKDKIEGFGVGLASVKTIVEGHGGQVLVESKLGKGSVFTVVLPKDRK